MAPSSGSRAHELYGTIIVGVNEAVSQNFPEHVRDKVVLIPNGSAPGRVVYPLVDRNELRATRGLTPEHKVVVYIGRIAVEKNVQCLIDAMEQVSWEEATEFRRKLSVREGKPYRLPTEAEWEYVCRAGTTTPLHFGSTLNGDNANMDGKYPYGTETEGRDLERPTDVGSYLANAFGLVRHARQCVGMTRRPL